MIEQVKFEEHHQCDRLTLTDKHLFLTICDDKTANYIVDLLSDQHTFLVTFLDADNPIDAYYKTNEGTLIEVSPSVIRSLEHHDFIYKIEHNEEAKENFPKKCHVIIRAC